MRTLTALVVMVALSTGSAAVVMGQEPGGLTPTEELLSGMVTEEVEPGVLRVVNDGYRDVGHPDDGFWGDDAVLVGAPGDVWRIIPPRRLYRLGQEPEWDYEPGLVDIGQAKTDAGPDGRLWTPALRSVRVFDGRSWGDPEPYSFGGDYETVAVQDDGTVWFLGEDHLMWIPPEGEPGGSRWADVYDDEVVPFELAVSGDGEAWLMGDSDFLRFDGNAWQVEPAPAGTMAWPSPYGRPFDVGPGGALWTAGDALQPHESLARLDDDGWTIFTADDGVEPWGALQAGWWTTDIVEVAPDGSTWVSASEAGTCDGLARFDGKTWTSYLPGRCISDLDFAPDGNLWVVAQEPEGVSEVNTYVISPNVVTATE